MGGFAAKCFKSTLIGVHELIIIKASLMQSSPQSANKAVSLVNTAAFIGRTYRTKG